MMMMMAAAIDHVTVTGSHEHLMADPPDHTPYRSNMIPGLCANKIGNRGINDKTGEEYLQETAPALVLSAEISGVTAVLRNADM